MIGDFRSPDLHYTGWLEHVPESIAVRIISPKDKTIFFTDPGASKKEITISGTVPAGTTGKIVVIVRTDRDYPQAFGKPHPDGTWSFSGITLGGVDHQVYAVLVDDNDKPLSRSQVIRLRLERKT